MYGLGIRMKYRNTFEVICGKCEIEAKEIVMSAVFHDVPGECPDEPLNTFVTYDCPECGYSVSSEKYHKYHDYTRNKLQVDEVEMVFKTLNSFVNNMSCPMDMLIERMSRAHRTIQQNYTGFALAWLQHLAKLPEGHYDLRNEASVKLAKEIMEKVEGANYKLP